jgi:hypothetical protein
MRQGKRGRGEGLVSNVSRGSRGRSEVTEATGTRLPLSLSRVWLLLPSRCMYRAVNWGWGLVFCGEGGVEGAPGGGGVGWLGLLLVGRDKKDRGLKREVEG